MRFYIFENDKADVGTYAVATKHPSKSSTKTLCCPAILATLPRISLNSPFVITTSSPNLYLMFSEVTGMI